MNDETEMKLYKAIIWKRGSDTAGLRVTTYAHSLAEAKEKLESEYGVGNVYDLHNEEEASRLRI